MIAIPRMQLVFMPLNIGAGALTPFPNVSNLTGGDVEIIGIAAYTSDQLATAPNNQAVITPADSLNVVCNFQKGSDQKFMQIPYFDLVRANNAGIWVQVEPFQLDLTKSGTQNTALITASSAAFMFYYRLISQR